MPKRLGKFELPSKLTKVEDGATPTYAKFIAEPFEAGYGHTVGNSLRRVLLSSIEGAAISSIKIDGVNHEFQSIDGVVEDVTEIVLNLKKVLIVSHKRETISLAIKATRPAPSRPPTSRPTPTSRSSIPTRSSARSTASARSRPRSRSRPAAATMPRRAEQEGGAGDRRHPDRFALLPGQAREVRRREHPRRPDHRLRQADPRDLDGRAHHAGRRPEAGRLDPQAPPRRVRPRQRGAYEFESQQSEVSEEQNKLRKLLNMSVNEIELSVRAANCLNNANITTVGELAMKTEQEMLKYRNFGKKSLNEIKEKLEALGLSLGMKFDERLLDAKKEA
jgi:DNA-directed RNA polymerase subunit alpha